MPFVVSYGLALDYGFLTLLITIYPSLLVMCALGIIPVGPAYLVRYQKSPLSFSQVLWMVLCLATYAFVFYLILSNLDWHHVSWYRFVVVSGFLAFFFYVVAAILAIASTVAIEKIYSAHLGGSVADAAFAHCLVEALDTAGRTKRDWESLDVKRKLMKELEAAADAVSRKVARALPTSDIYTDAWLRHRLESIGAAIREKKRLVCIPEVEARQRLVDSLSGSLTNLALGNWEGIETSGSRKVVSPEKGAAPQEVVRQDMRIRLRSLARGTVAAFLPAAVYVGAEMLGLFEPLGDSPLKGSLAIVVVVWAVISLLFVIDPRFADKIETVQDLVSMIPGVSRKRGD
jgi:hypothetical protein